MSRQDANAAFARTSFLYGGNAAYLEQLHSRYESDPGSVDAEWRAVFEGLKDDKRAVERSASGPSWQRPNIPHADGELVAALTGDWGEVEKSVGDKIKAKAQSKGVEVSAGVPPYCVVSPRQVCLSVPQMPHISMAITIASSPTSG